MSLAKTNLRDYKGYPPTSSCYLDGRYFNMLFNFYPGLIKAPLVINLKEYVDNQNETKIQYTAIMESAPVRSEFVNILRIIINTPNSRHSNVALIDFNNRKIYWFDPIPNRYSPAIKEVLDHYLHEYIDFDIVPVNINISPETTPGCEKSGFCLAYSTKYVYDWLTNGDFDMSDIRKFAFAIEHKLGALPIEGADIEYGFVGPVGRNVAIGALGGGLIGGVFGGPAGFLLGAGIGGLAGAAFTPSYYYPGGYYPSGYYPYYRY